MYKNLRVTLSGRTYDVIVEVLDESKNVATPTHFPTPAALDKPKAELLPTEGHIVAPLPGTVLHVDCNVGDEIELNQKVLSFEAMKMETAVFSPLKGTVVEILVQKGDQISEGQRLIKIS